MVVMKKKLTSFYIKKSVSFVVPLMRRLAQVASLTSLRLARHSTQAMSRDQCTAEEYAHLSQPLPDPSELLAVTERNRDTMPKNVENDDMKVPGDSFGIMRNRCVFYRPIPRNIHNGEFGHLFPEGIDPRCCLNPIVLKRLSGSFGVSADTIVNTCVECHGDINLTVRQLTKQSGKPTPFGSYGLVALESYVPEAFCLASFHFPSFEATRDPDVLEAVHELVLSAAELPLDTPRSSIKDKFLSWTTDDGTRCEELMRKFDITLHDVVLLPHGEYSAVGFFVANPHNEDFPNIGVGAAACSLDLRTGIHNRFRFHVERIADSVAEHVALEQLHVGQEVHVLRQPYWFHPDYSVEEFIRFKEGLLQPSASVFEMRYATMLAPVCGTDSYRNLVELEKLKVAQHKYEKHYEDLTTPGKWLTTDGSQLQTVSAGTGGSGIAGSTMHRANNNPGSTEKTYETQTRSVRDVFQNSMQSHGDRIFSRFYRSNHH